ncbi:MAG: hypothetical protein KC457_31195, partial [Myxococcales bacterium]|nr:hypothetical protein [Myxococcales bacterium]
IVDNNCNNNNCINQNCGAEVLACYTGALTCGDLAACAQNCAGDQACITSCYLESTPLAQDQSEALQACIADNQCADDICIAENCGPELQSCVGGMSDELPCPIVASCVLDCGNDDICIAACQSSSSAAAEAEVPPLLACADAQNCNDFNCTQMACPAEWLACTTGDNDCATTWECFTGCGGAQVCEYNCITEGDPGAQMLFGSLAQCAQQNQCADDQCLMDNCGSQLAACGL